MKLLELLFFISLLTILHGLGGYILVIYLYKVFQKNSNQFEDELTYYPTISVLIAAYNEEQCIENKILNSLNLNYPTERFEIVVVTDGSTDNTVNIINKYPQIKLYHTDNRLGKVSAINRIMSSITSELTVFSDANTELNRDCLLNLMNHFKDPRVGGVSGEKKVRDNKLNTGADKIQESFYWKYESFLKQMDAKFYSIVGTAGEIYAIRTSLYCYPDPNIILDDFIISIDICKQGYLFKYEKNAFAIESSSLNINEEKKRKLRIATGGIQSIIANKELFSFWRYPKLSYLFISHRVLRWTIIPILLIILFIINIYIISYTDTTFYWLILFAQIIFYCLSIVGMLSNQLCYRYKFISIPYYFLFMNYCQLIGMVKYFKGQHTSIWEKSKRIQ